MREIFVNLKRFDIPKKYGGLCPSNDPVAWIESVVRETIEADLARIPSIHLSYLLPESLVRPAANIRDWFLAEQTRHLSIGIQGLYREDVADGGNFGAFTTHTPAAAAKSLGAQWAIIGHSEERKDKRGILERFDPSISSDAEKSKMAGETVSALINEEVLCALQRGINVLLCIGETAEERGNGTVDQQIAQAQWALESQIRIALNGIAPELLRNTHLVIGYEPLWAIGPGKTPPGPDYIASVASFIKTTARNLHNLNPMVVYGGGLKEENAAAIGSVDGLDGGLIALTRFVPPIGFDVQALKRIVQQYAQASGERL